jgi:dihydrofolate reductase
MRKIVVGEFVSLDGVMETPENWTFQYWTDEIGAQLGSSFVTSDAFLLGRVTYDTFKATFSHQSGGQADGMNNLAKYVVSTTLKSADWQNSTLIKGNIPDEIAKLKQEPGKDITVTGSATLVKTLMQHNLVDEYSLLVYPVVLGTGIRLFPNGIALSNLKLVETKSFSTGVVLLRYQTESKA